MTHVVLDAFEILSGRRRFADADEYAAAPRTTPPPPKLPESAQALLMSLGMGSIVEAAILAMGTERERVFAYWPGVDL